MLIKIEKKHNKNASNRLLKNKSEKKTENFKKKQKTLLLFTVRLPHNENYVVKKEKKND